MLVDSHCHLDHLDLSQHQHSLSNLLDYARSRGVGKFLSVGVNLEASEKLTKLAEHEPDVVVSVGVHPLQDELPELPELSQLVELSRHPKVVALGETGLDYYYDEKNADWQQNSFHRHLQAALEVDKPVIVHTRNARQDTLDILGDYASQKPRGVLHCFTESLEMAEAALDMGFYISFSGIITFKNAAALRDVVKQVPLERLLVETDAPWLAPVPYRGKQNQPAWVVEVANAVADIKGLSPAQVVTATTENFYTLFGDSFHA